MDKATEAWAGIGKSNRNDDLCLQRLVGLEGFPE
jgi:hypothetical protein